MTRRQFLLASAAFFPVPVSCGRTSPFGHGGALPANTVARSPNPVSLRRSVLSALNTARRSDGQGPLVISESLCRAALSHARDLAGQGLVGHRGTDGSTPAMRAPRTGFDGRVLGEVVARAPDHEVSVLRDWLDQPESRAVLLDPQARQMGVARHVTPDGMGWWVLLVGTGGDQG